MTVGVRSRRLPFEAFDTTEYLVERRETNGRHQMVDFNKTKGGSKDRQTTNKAGGVAYQPEPKEALFKRTVNNLLENTEYESDLEAVNGVADEFASVVDRDPKYVLQMAWVAREVHGLRDISIMLLALSAGDRRTNGDNNSEGYVREYVPRVVQRADEPARLIGAFDFLYGYDGVLVGDDRIVPPEDADRVRTTLPNSLKKGLAERMGGFDEYEFSKYDTDRREYNLRDVANLTHPKAEDAEHEALFERLVRGRLSDYPDVEELTPPPTWEVALSEVGTPGGPSSKREAFESVIDRMGLFATIRNLRGMLNAGVSPEVIRDRLDDFSVESSRLFPFRFYQAARAIGGFEKYESRRTLRAKRFDTGIETDADISSIVEWLSLAINQTADHLPETLGRSIIGCDLSGSMDDPIANSSTLSRKEIAVLFAALCMGRGGVVAGFGDTIEIVSDNDAEPTSRVSSEPPRGRPIEFARMDAILSHNRSVGNSTNGYKVLDYAARLANEGIDVDRIILFTDEQLWDSSNRGGFYSSRSTRRTVKEALDDYRQVAGRDVPLYVIDLASYGDIATPPGYKNVFRVSGWNSSVLEFIKHAEDPDTAVRAVEEFDGRWPDEDE